MPSALTRAAEGYDRRAFTVDEVLLMQELGIFAEDENFELIEGEIVPVNAKHLPHTRVEFIITHAMHLALVPGLEIGLDTTVQLSPKTFVQPDACLYRPPSAGRILEADDVELAVEVSDSTLSRDRGLKARLYARSGIPELWVVDVATRRTFVHRQPSRDGWGDVQVVEPGQPLTTPALPGLSLVLPSPH